MKPLERLSIISTWMTINGCWIRQQQSNQVRMRCLKLSNWLNFTNSIVFSRLVSPISRSWWSRTLTARTLLHLRVTVHPRKRTRKTRYVLERHLFYRHLQGLQEAVLLNRWVKASQIQTRDRYLPRVDAHEKPSRDSTTCFKVSCSYQMAVSLLWIASFTSKQLKNR